VAGDAADSAWTDAAGRFAIPNLPRRALAVLGRPGEAPRGLAHELARAVVPGGDELVFEVDAARGPREPARAGALLRIEGKNGKPIAGGEVRLWSLATGRGVTLARAADAYALAAPLPAGAYEVEALVPGRAPLHLGPLHLPGGAGGDGADLGVLRVAPRGTLRLHEEADEEVLARWTAALWELRGDARVLVTAVAGALPKRLDLPAGRYELDLAPNAEHAAVALLLERGAAPPARRLAFDVAPGRTTRVELRRDARGAAAAVSPDAPPPADDLPARVAAAARLLADAEGTVAVEDVVVLVDPDSAADAFRSTEPLRPVVLEVLTDMFDRSSCTRCH
jgi:hypothetical protein